MFKRLIGLLFCGACMMATLTSCGGDGVGGGVGEFTTVNASAVPDTPRLESDLIDGNTCSSSGSTGGTFKTDSVNVDVISTALFSTGALKLKISKVTVSYFPITDTMSTPAVTPPPLSDFVNYTGFIVDPGATVTIPVTVMPDSYKIALFTRSTQNIDACSATLYEYIARITFEVSEIGGNGKTRYVTTDINVAVADRASS